MLFIEILLVVAIIAALVIGSFCLAYKIDEDYGVPTWIAILIVLVVSAGVYSAMQPSTPLTGYVASKQFQQAHTTYVLVGKVMVPQSVPDKWIVTVKSDNDERACSMSEGQWIEVQVGQEFTCP